MNTLRRLVWRKEAGLITASEMNTSLSDAFSGLVERYAAARNDWSQFLKAGHVISVQSAAFDHAITQGRQAMRGRHWRLALNAFEQADVACNQLAQAAATTHSLRLAKDKHQFLLALFKDGNPALLPTNISIDRLAKVSDKLFDSAEFRQARFVADQMVREIEILVAPCAESAQVAATLSERVVHLEALRDRHPNLLRLQPQTAEICRFIAVASEAIVQHRYVLAERVLDDVEVITAPLASLASEMNRQADRISESDSSRRNHAHVKMPDDVESWDDASDRLLESGMSNLANRLSHKLAYSIAQQQELSKAQPSWPYVRIYRD